MCGSALPRQRFCQNLLVEPIGFSYPATQIYPFDGAFEISFGDIDKETWRSAFAVVYAINDTNRIDDKRTPFGKQSVDCPFGCTTFRFWGVCGRSSVLKIKPHKRLLPVKDDYEVRVWSKKGFISFYFVLLRRGLRLRSSTELRVTEPRCRVSGRHPVRLVP